MTDARSLRRGLLARVALVGALQLVAFAALAMLVAFLGERAAMHAHERAFLASTEIADLAAHLDDSGGLARAVERIHEERSLDLTVYDREGRVRASSIDPPLPRGPEGFHRRRPRPPGRGVLFGPPPGPPGHRMHDGFPHPPRAIVRLDLRSGVGFVVLRPSEDAHRFVAPLVFFAIALVVVVVSATLLARSIVRPLEALAESARRLGAGALKTRVGTSRDDEIGDVARAFDAMAERVESLLRAERELLANVSHELRTPLARIRVAIDLASEGDSTAARSSLAEIAIDLDELERLVDDVMSATRIALDDGSATPTPLAPRRERVEAATLVERSAQRFRSHHPGHVLDTSGASDPMPLDVDPTLVRRVLDNLLDNAAKHAPERSTLAVRTSVAGERARIEVQDHGIGVDEADLPRLFEPFFRADRSRTRGTGGVGLGLALAKRIVEEHGGTIAVKSRVDEGTTFTIELPLAR